MFGKRHMETNEVKMCKRYENCENYMKRRGQKEHSKQGGIDKTNLYS